MNILIMTSTWLSHPVFNLLLVPVLMLATTGRVFADDITSDAGGQSPATVIKNTVQTMLSRANAESAELNGDPEKLVALVSEIVIPHLDMTRISRMVLGKAWRKADKTQFQRFSEEFQLLLIRTYAASLSQSAAANVHFPTQEKQYKNGTAAVELKIQRPGEPSIELEFRLHNKLGPWLVYDIKIEGISLVANYRAEFTDIIRSKGLDALIVLLENKNKGTRVASISQ